MKSIFFFKSFNVGENKDKFHALQKKRKKSGPTVNCIKLMIGKRLS